MHATAIASNRMLLIWLQVGNPCGHRWQGQAGVYERIIDVYNQWEKQKDS